MRWRLRLRNMKLSQHLESLDDAITKVAPAVAESLADGIDADDMKDIIDEYADQLKEAQVKFPKELRELFAWHDGSDGESFIGELYLLDAEECLSVWLELTEMIGFDFELENWWHQGWFPFAGDGSGNYVCVDTEGVAGGKPGQIIWHWHDDEEREILTDSLAEWVEAVLEQYRAKIDDEDDQEPEDSAEGEEDEDEDDDWSWDDDEDVPEEPEFDSRSFTVGPAKAKPVFKAE